MSAHTTSAERVANEFCRLLKIEIGSERVRAAASRNRIPEYEGCCASHDFCDANMVMADAVKEVTGRECTTEDGDLDLMNAAWNIAKANNLGVTP